MSLKEYLNKNGGLGDPEIIADTLGGQKSLITLYSTAIIEGSTSAIRDLFRQNMTECATDHFASFEYMAKNNLYPIEEAPTEKIKEAVTTFKAKKPK